jgi:putative heme degradation protein
VGFGLGRVEEKRRGPYLFKIAAMIVKPAMEKTAISTTFLFIGNRAITNIHTGMTIKKTSEEILNTICTIE